MKKLLSENRFDLLIGGVIYCIYMIAYFFPEKLWGMHFSSFLKTSQAFFFLALPLILVSAARVLKNNTKVISLTNDEKFWSYFRFLMPFIAAFLFYSFPIADDFYGNARNFYFTKGNVVVQLPHDFFEKLFSLNITPGQGRGGVRLLVEFISFHFQISLEQSFIVLNAVFGGIYVFLMLQLISTHIQRVLNRVVVSIAFLSSPMFLIYFGHIETYAPVFLLLLIWMILFFKIVETQKAVLLLPLLVVLLIGIRLHTFFVLLLPSVALLSSKLFFPNKFPPLTKLKSSLQYIYLPLLVLGLLAYFFVFKDYNDPRKLTNFEDIERLFLPIVSPAIPLDQYNLLSWNHTFDFINVVVLWSPAFIFIAFLFVRFRKQLNWNSLEVSSLILALIIYITFLFAVNPLLSMPMDWDLFMFPVTIVMGIILLLFKQSEARLLTAKRRVIVVSLAILCIPSFVCLLNAKPNSYRVESLGKHIYKTYYEHASTYILYALKNEKLKEEYPRRLNETIEELKPFANKGNDKQYADLLLDYSIYIATLGNKDKLARTIYLNAFSYAPEAKFYDYISTLNMRLIEKDYQFSTKDQELSEKYGNEGMNFMNSNLDTAIVSFRDALIYDPLSVPNNLKLLECYFITQDYTASYLQAIAINKLKLLSASKSLRILIHMALEAAYYEKAIQHSSAYLKLNPKDELILSIYDRLLKKENVDQLKFKFRRNMD